MLQYAYIYFFGGVSTYLLTQTEILPPNSPLPAPPAPLSFFSSIFFPPVDCLIVCLRAYTCVWTLTSSMLQILDEMNVDYKSLVEKSELQDLALRGRPSTAAQNVSGHEEVSDHLLEC